MIHVLNGLSTIIMVAGSDTALTPFSRKNGMLNYRAGAAMIKARR
jgi:hypothetical protein